MLSQHSHFSSSGCSSCFLISVKYNSGFLLEARISEPLLLRWLNWGALGIWRGCPLDAFLKKCFGHVQLGRGPEAETGHVGEIISLSRPRYALVFPQRSWRRWPGLLRSGSFCLGCCPCNSTLDKWKWMDGWIILSPKTSARCRCDCKVMSYLHKMHADKKASSFSLEKQSPEKRQTAKAQNLTVSHIP